MRDPGPSFLCGVELECQAYLDGGPGEPTSRRALELLLDEHYRGAPALRARNGFFNAYGRVYLDWGHYELASAECASPYDVPGVLERQEMLLGRALARLRRAGVCLRLSNNNHAGLLDPGSPTWGAHESYLVRRDPATFGPSILPFLATRLYAGAGGVRARDGAYLACVRAEFLRTDEGGLTVDLRALHSTCRQESLMGERRGAWRYHLILGDGLRSHFGLALTLGATLLTLRAIEHDAGLPARVEAAGYRVGSGRTAHLDALLRLNVLAPPGHGPRAHPLAIAVQRAYLEAGEAWAGAQRELPAWVPTLLADWRATLDALRAGDLGWLRARLDAFAKHALVEATLAQEGVSWARLARDLGGQARIALLAHDYHDLGRPDGLFRRLESAGLVAHRVAVHLEPGGEPEPFVPELGTRATARARRIRERAHDPGLVCDWASIEEPTLRRAASLADPFARELEPPAELPAQPVPRRSARRAVLRSGPPGAPPGRGELPFPDPTPPLPP